MLDMMKSARKANNVVPVSKERVSKLSGIKRRQRGTPARKQIGKLVGQMSRRFWWWLGNACS